jgi:hypothetical protein
MRIHRDERRKVSGSEGWKTGDMLGRLHTYSLDIYKEQIQPDTKKYYISEVIDTVRYNY